MQRYGLLIILIAAATDAFMPLLAHQRRAFAVSSSTSSLQMAGFGGASAPKKGGKKAKKDIKLKPKQQWDRYISDDLKDSDSVRVAVRKINAAEGWLEVGAVKSKENAHTEASVIRHRVLIADHARRLFPLQILAKDKVEWGYTSTATAEPNGEEDVVVEWRVAGKVEDMPDDIDRLIGFQGLPDLTGFYAFSKSKGLGQTSTKADFESMMTKRIV